MPLDDQPVMAQAEPTVAKVMSKPVMAVELNTSARDCAKAMAKRGVSCAVITQGGSAIGIVTERDLVSKVLTESIDPRNVLVRDIMSTPLITVGPNAPMTAASELMAQYRIRRLVVVDTTGTLVGIITTGDIARALAEKHGYREPTFNAMARYAEGVEGGPYQ
jgi:CBS domain-containing protein